MHEERTGLFFMMEEKEAQGAEKKVEEDKVEATLRDYLEMHKKEKFKAVFICAMTEKNENHSTSAGKHGTEYEMLGALDLAHTNLKMDWIMQSKAMEVLGALLDSVGKQSEEEPVVH